MTSAIHPVKRRRRRTGKQEKVSFSQDFGPYQVCLLAATQISYMPVTASILCTNFMKMSKDGCAAVLEARNGSSSSAPEAWYTSGTVSSGLVPEGEFRSLLAHWDLHCTEKRGENIQTAMSTMIMLGGLVGAFASGFFADRYGRKPVVIGSLAAIAASNALLLALRAPLAPWPVALPIFFALGVACGGYMTTNLVLVVESLCRASSRLLVVALNGWSLSMAGTALLAFLCPDWFQYHAALAVISAICAVVLYFIADESLRWLKSSHKVTRFTEASARLVRFNGGEDGKDIALLCQLERDGAPPPQPLVVAREADESGGQAAALMEAGPSVSYLDLFAERSLRPRLFSLAYCFFCSSVVSFGFYLASDSLSGNRYMNMAVMGGGKFLAGLVPFIVASFVSRKQMALVSLGAAAVAAWVVLACLLAGLSLQSIAITVLSLFATIALDPTWKISHLYSTELFPTSMRNMARGFCNSSARIGSVLAPLIVHLRHDIPPVCFGLFAVLLTAQFAITARFLPNQAPSELQDAVVGSPDGQSGIHSDGRKPKHSEYEQEEDAEREDERSRDSSQLSESAPLTP